MSTRDLIMMAVRNLWKRKLRTFLTVLGVVIGTTSIVVMISIGIGMNESFQKQVEEWGSLQVIDVYSNSSDMFISSDTNQNKGKPPKNAVLDAATIDKFKQMEYVEAVSPIVRDSMMLVCGKYVSNASFIGLDPSTMEALGYKVEEGRTLTAEDKEGIVIGRSVITSFYNPKLSWQMQMQSEAPEINVMEDKVVLTYDWSYGTKYADKSIKPIKTPVVGIMPDGGGNGYSVVMPLKQMEKIQKEKEAWQKKQGNSGNSNQTKKGEYQQVSVKVSDLNKVQEVQQQIKDMGFQASSLTDQLETMKETTKMLRIVLGAIGAVSLIVAAIGITNTMVMAIYERTREIGIMKVIGASLRDIKLLFLTEAAFIGFAGGVLGIVTSFLMSLLVNLVATKQASEMTSSIPVWLYLSAVAFATVIGVLSGYLPAKRAMKLSALTAIKTE